MTAFNHLCLWMIAGIIMAWSAAAHAEGTGDSQASSSSDTASSTAAKTGTHASTHHKKKKSAVAAGTTSSSPTATANPAGPATPDASKKTTVATTDATPKSTGKRKKSHAKHATASAGDSKKAPLTSTTRTGAGVGPNNPIPGNSIAGPTPISSPGKQSDSDMRTPIVITAPASSPLSGQSAGPEVETGLPVARHGGYDLSQHIDSNASPAGSYQIPSTIPVPSSLSSIGSYTPRTRAKNPLDNFSFTDFARHVRNIYPWKINIFTTIFWIGEGSTPISSTTNDASAWEMDWRTKNGGTDTPDDREGYMPAHHAARENPFYVALPFNDLKYPEVARRWLPAGWYRAPKDGKQVSACQHRWLEIKNAQGEVCYAQWEDVGPLNYSDAAYVFGDARPVGLGNDRAGLDVSPAVADYLNINGKNCFTRWRFVDDADVVPGRWLQYDEEALIFSALHQLKEDPARVAPIQRATAPIDDEEDVDSTKKRLGAAKG